MSNNDKSVPNVTTLPSPEEAAAAEETKPSFAQKTKTFVKTHKKPLIAAGLLTGLVGVSALTGRKTATVTLNAQSPLEIENAEIVEDVIVEDDTVTA